MSCSNCQLQILKRLWATLACLGVTHIHITGAEKVEAAYYGATVLHPHHILPQLIVGKELLPWQLHSLQACPLHAGL